MSATSRREYLEVMRRRYRSTQARPEKSALVDELVQTVGYHRKHALRILARPPAAATKRAPKPLMYREALPAIQAVWEALDYACAERVHPVLLWTAEHLASLGAITLTAAAREQLAHISRATLARRLARLPRPHAKLYGYRLRAQTALLKQIPIEKYAFNESRPGALEIDLVEHNGGSASGHYAYTLSVTDVVTGWSSRRAVLGRSQRAVFAALSYIIDAWPIHPWALHGDNGSEFMNDHLLRYTKQNGLKLLRSRPYRKNDNAHVEQRNRQYVREVVGYDRYDTECAVAWLNQIYSVLDTYANLFLPTMKLVAKSREGAKIRKRFDQAQTPLDRLLATGVLDHPAAARLIQQRSLLNPLTLRHEVNHLVASGAAASVGQAAAAES